MKYNENDIEIASQILTRRESLSDEQVRAWMSDPEHVELLKEFAAIHQEYVEISFEKDRAKEFTRLKEAVGSRNSRRITLRWSVAASIILLIGLFVGVAVNEWGDLGEDRMLAQTEQIVPGVKAELILGTGERVSLAQQNVLIEGTKELGILNDSLTGLNYMTARVQGENVASATVFNTIQIPVGGFYQLTLADGTKVWLNSVTKLRYPVTFTGEERKVHLTGEAYFEVAHDADHPFIVEVDGVDVKVYGTEFNVNTFKADVVQTVLVQGKVGVTVNRTGEERMMKPNEMLEYNSRENTIRVAEVDPSFYTAWKVGDFMFKNARLEDIMEQLSRWYGVEVFYVNEDVKNRTFTGSAARFEDIHDLLRIIEKTAIVSFSIKNKTIVVSSGK